MASGDPLDPGGGPVRDRSIYQGGFGVYGSDYWRDFGPDASSQGHDRMTHDFAADHGPETSLSERNFRGIGPKGWVRGDSRIHEEICERLEAHPDIDASDIEVQVTAGEVLLSGQVGDRRSRQLAVDEAERVSGVRKVTSELRRR